MGHIQSAAELRAQADIECQKADELAFTGRDIDGRFTCAFPDIALAYFGFSEELRQEAFELEMGDAINVLRVLAKGINR